MNHLNEEQLVLYHYGEAQDRGDAAEHLESCESCRANYQALQRVLAAVDNMPVPERNEGYGAEVWRQLRPQLGDRTARVASRWSEVRSLFQLPRWVLAGGLAALVVGAFLAGRFWSQPTPNAAPSIAQAPSPLPLSPQARERVLLREIGDHLERSQLALIELINTRTNGAVDISAEQVLARELAAINRLFRRAAADAGEPGMAGVLEELELVLVEIGNGPVQLSADEFTALRQRVGDDGLLFKVKVVTAQVRAKQRDASRELAANRS
ncbi:MAG TPA: hypothetical protein VJW76_11140 [Verrucomicrobiae bacterium]|nr:hypothetical protein [Verrucomicrobiae bacterium]